MEPSFAQMWQTGNSKDHNMGRMKCIFFSFHHCGHYFKMGAKVPQKSLQATVGSIFILLISMRPTAHASHEVMLAWDDNYLFLRSVRHNNDVRSCEYSQRVLTGTFRETRRTTVQGKGVAAIKVVQQADKEPGK